MTHTKHNEPLKELLVEELRDLLHAEGQLVKALPKMAKAAHHPKLKEAFGNHLEQTEGHVQRLTEALDLLGEKPQPKPCKAMMGLMEEGKETIEEGQHRDEAAADLGLIIAAHKVEHYEISGYSSCISLAKRSGHKDVAALLALTLGEEQNAADLLSDLTKPLMDDADSNEPVVATKGLRAKAQRA